MTKTYDVVVVGAGPVGLMFSACLARLGSYKIKHVDNSAEPTAIGRADGIQARTLDVLNSMGLKRPIWAYNPGLIYEVVFWGATPDGQGIQRTGTSKSYPEHVNTRYPFTTILHQGRIEGIFLDDLRARGVEIQRPWTVGAVNYRGSGSEYPIDVELVSVDGSATETVHSKYLFGADGARSAMRDLLKIPMMYKDPTVHVWSVIDGVVVSDFPDMQPHADDHSSNAPSARPGVPAWLSPKATTAYVQIPSDDDSKNLPASASQAKIQQRANEILSPYRVEWETVDWHSVYHIGQGISQKYSLNNRIFIGGDACHTHSPKAGQGMNYGLLDAHNLSWKLHLVESGLMRPELLHTYEEERRAVASRLIEFDVTYAGLFSSRNPSQQTNDEFVRIFKQSSLLTSGYGVEYPPNTLTQVGDDGHDLIHASLNGLRPGWSFPPVNVTRVIDACEIPLEREVPFNCSFHVYVFAGESQHPKQQNKLADLARQLSCPDSVFSRVQDIQGQAGVDMSYDSRHNPHSALYTVSLVFNAVRASIEISKLPQFFRPYRYHIYSDDARSRKSREGGQGAAHAALGFDPQEGGVVVVRPHGYVGCIVRLVEGRVTGESLDQYFSRVVPDTQISVSIQSRL